MNQLTEEQRERVKQIRERQYNRSVGKLSARELEIFKDVESLLSLLDSQAAERSIFPLPEWADCQSMFADGTMTPLSEFVRAYEPIQSTSPDDKTADQWRQGLAAVINHIATAMRDICVETIRDLRPEATGAGAFKDAAIKALQSLTFEAAATTQKEGNDD